MSLNQLKQPQGADRMFAPIIVTYSNLQSKMLPIAQAETRKHMGRLLEWVRGLVKWVNA